MNNTGTAGKRIRRMILHCEICRQQLGQFDTATVSKPLTAEMFTSLDPERYLPPPFIERSTWRDFLCPWCGSHPFLQHSDYWEEPNRLYLGNYDYWTIPIPYEIRFRKFDMYEQEPKKIRKLKRKGKSPAWFRGYRVREKKALLLKRFDG